MSYCFGIVEHDPVVRLDLVETLKHSFPDSLVEALVDVHDIAGLLCRFDRAFHLFVAGSVIPDLDKTVVEYALQSKGAIISIGTHDKVPFHVRVLEKPFTSAMVLKAVAISAPDLHGHLPEGHT